MVSSRISPGLRSCPWYGEVVDVASRVDVIPLIESLCEDSIKSLVSCGDRTRLTVLTRLGTVLKLCHEAAVELHRHTTARAYLGPSAWLHDMLMQAITWIKHLSLLMKSCYHAIRMKMSTTKDSELVCQAATLIRCSQS